MQILDVEIQWSYAWISFERTLNLSMILYLHLELVFFLK